MTTSEFSNPEKARARFRLRVATVFDCFFSGFGFRLGPPFRAVRVEQMIGMVAVCGGRDDAHCAVSFR